MSAGLARIIGRMRWRTALPVGAVGLFAAGLVLTLHAQQPPPAAGPSSASAGPTAAAPPPHVFLVDEYCVACHDEDKKKGDLALDTIAGGRMKRCTRLLPVDEASYGFDNVTVGDLSPTLLDRYISAAEKISRPCTRAFSSGSTVTGPSITNGRLYLRSTREIAAFTLGS